MGLSPEDLCKRSSNIVMLSVRCTGRFHLNLVELFAELCADVFCVFCVFVYFEGNSCQKYIGFSDLKNTIIFTREETEVVRGIETCPRC